MLSGKGMLIGGVDFQGLGCNTIRFTNPESKFYQWSVGLKMFELLRKFMKLRFKPTKSLRASCFIH